jgi:IS30 family transposase
VHTRATLPLPTEFHGYSDLEDHTGTRFYFATPYHSWQRGSSENANGLIRQYAPKRKSFARLSQHRCAFLADKLNNRPRKRLDYLTPKEACDLLSD